ncbi:putative acetyltransferase [Aquimixticola soesokkakensis]|uniref:Putative acetyltransferase n=1 Tax=Aquimixticola soesokkakensis TaxID=1519096 RepID=A0A1Y5SV10_9RHOB|nr:GNAT family N-acetyltransferase [Aquimixticola soesokkakensis]SLN49039.1 putative acetyltransferase [Aquimixticola soesokkakensis]
MTHDLEIRKATSEDESGVRLCAEDAYEQYVAAIGKKPAPMVADFGSLIASGSVYIAVEADAELNGFIVFYQEDDYFMLENVAVHANATGKGVGKRLITFCEQQAKQSGVKRVKLYTNEKMSENLSIYPHLGYREIDRRTEDGFNRVFFEKSL